MKKVVLIFITAITFPYVSLAQGVNGTSYPTNGTTYYGRYTDTGASNSSSTYFGSGAGWYISGNHNLCVGADAGSDVVGSLNVFLGGAAGGYMLNSSRNTFVGNFSGLDSYNTNNSVYMGYTSGYESSGNYNLYLGSGTGTYASGDNNIFIGKNVGYGLNASNKLYIDNTNTSSPLIYGEFDNNILTVNGRLGIGTKDFNGYELGVKGKIAAQEVLVQVYPWPDYVFENNYNLPSLQEVERHIKEKGHLQNMPSAEEAEKNGILLGDMNAKLLQKIEELTLYTIQQQKELEEQKDKNSSLETRLKKLEQLLSNK